MVKCPKCEEEISYLYYNAKTNENGTYENGDYETEGNDGWEDLVFSCPECREELFYDEDEANEFLNSDGDEEEETETEVLKADENGFV